MSGVRDVGVPPGWARVPIADLAEVNPKKLQPGYADDESLVFVPMANVAEDARGLLAGERRSFAAIRRGYCQFRPGDVLFAKITPCMENGKVAVVPEIEPPLGYGSTEFFVLRPRTNGIAEWVAWSVSRSQFRRLAQKSMQGAVGQLRVPKVWLQNAEIPLAPLSEQHRIVARIEALFAKLDDGIDALKRAETNLERYRASVLKAAVEGKLTARWRTDNPPDETGQELLRRILAERRNRWEQEQLARFADKGRKPPPNWKSKYKEPSAPDTRALPELPDGWCWATVDQIAKTMSGGTPDRKQDDWFGGGIAWVKSGELRDGMVYSSEETLSPCGLARSSAKIFPSGTLCIALYGATVGRVGILGMDAATNQAVCGIIKPCRVLPDYLAVFFRSIRSSLIRKGKGGAQSNISQGIVRRTAVPVPPLAEQQAAVALVERIRSHDAGHSEAVIVGLRRAAALRQSILKRAFEGRLVRQDPHDEPATVLLDSIRAKRERTAAPRNLRQRRVTPAAVGR